jgi:hypothetical protein
VNAKRWLAAAGLAALAPTLTGCVRFTYVQLWHEEPIADAQLQTLKPDQADLTACLHELGAPHYVWEDGDGMALGWVWLDKDDLSLDLSYSFFEDAPGASFSYGREIADLPGCVLWFDESLRLRKWQRGMMGELTRSLRRRPADPEIEH